MNCLPVPASPRFRPGQRLPTPMGWLPTSRCCAAGAERVKLCLLFQVGAKSHCKMFFPPLALRVVLKLNWFWLANKNRTAKLNFLRNVVNPVWKINPKMFFPSLTLWLRPLFACHPSLSAPSVDMSVGGKSGVLVLRCCGEQQWELIGAGTSWLGQRIFFFPLLLIVPHLVFLLLCSCCPPSLCSAWRTLFLPLQQVNAVQVQSALDV